MIALLGAALLLMDYGPPEARAEAAECLRRGNDAFRAGQFQAAADQYGRAYALFPSTKLLYNLGKAYDGAGRKPEALDAFQRFLEGLSGEPPEVRGELADRARSARARVEALRAEVPDRMGASGGASGGAPARAASTVASTMTTTASVVPVPPAPSPATPPPRLGHAAPPVAAAPAKTPPITLHETPPPPSTLYRLRWWMVGAGAVVVGAATTFLVVRWYKGQSCPDTHVGCL